MPYRSTSELPSGPKKLPSKRRRQWMHVFNSVLKQTGSESRAARAAWSQTGPVKKKEFEDDIAEEQAYVRDILAYPMSSFYDASTKTDS